MNMPYCRFHNALECMQECCNALANREIHSFDEAQKAEALILLCRGIALNYQPTDALTIYNEYVDAEEE